MFLKANAKLIIFIKEPWGGNTRSLFSPHYLFLHCLQSGGGGCVFDRCEFKPQVAYTCTQCLGTSRMPIALRKVALPSSTHSRLCVELLPGNRLDRTQLL